MENKYRKKAAMWDALKEKISAQWCQECVGKQSCDFWAYDDIGDVLREMIETEIKGSIWVPCDSCEGREDCKYLKEKGK